MESVGLFKDLEAARRRRNSLKEPSKQAFEIAGIGSGHPEGTYLRAAAAREIIEVFAEIGVDRNALADEIGLSRSSTGHWSRGENSISRHNLAVLIDALRARYLPAHAISVAVVEHLKSSWALALVREAAGARFVGVSFADAVRAAEAEFPTRISLAPNDRFDGTRSGGVVRMESKFESPCDGPVRTPTDGVAALGQLAYDPLCNPHGSPVDVPVHIEEAAEFLTEQSAADGLPAFGAMHWVRIGDDYRCGDMVISPDEPGYQVTHKICGREIVVGVLQLADAFALCHELGGARAAV